MRPISFKIVLVATLSMLFVFFAWMGQYLRFDNSRWLAPDDPTEILKNYTEKHFDQSEELVIAITLKKSFFSPETLNSLIKLEQTLVKHLPGDKIEHPLNITFLLRNSQKSLEATSLAKKFVAKQLGPKEMRHHFVESYYHGRYLSKDFRSFLIIIRPKLPKDSVQQDHKRGIINKIVTQQLQNHPLFSNFKMAGGIKLNHELNVQNLSELKRLLPLALCMMVIILGAYYASFKVSFIVAFSALLSSLGSFFLLSLLDIPINMLTSIVPVLIMAIAVSDSVHILDRYIHQECQDFKALIKFTWKPCFITSLTTAIGFASFYNAKLTTIQELSRVAPLAIILAYILIVGSNWSLLYLLKPKLSTPRHPLWWIVRWLRFEPSPKALAMLAIFLSASGFAIYNLAYTETSLLDAFFKPDSHIQKDFDYIDKNHGGTGSFDLIIGRKAEINFKDIKTYQKVIELKNILEPVAGIERVESYIMPVRSAHQKLTSKGRDPASSEALAQELLFLEFSQRADSADVLRPFLNFDGKVGRLVLRTKSLSNRQAQKVKNSLQNRLNNLAWPKELAGGNEYFLRLGELLLGIQVSSLSLTLLAIFILMGLFYHIRASVTATMINIVPICMVMLCIVLTQTPFDFSTVLIASICLGLSVDNSIHLIHYLSHPYKLSREWAFIACLRPVAVVALVFLAIFLIFGASNIVLLQHFGLFSALMVGISLLTNIFLVPMIYAPARPVAKTT